ncbi:hypothetical protein [Halobellus litoreus]|uniref:Uncharacterized protein n=1 Tax=Halobellus litoreus TaxID=755310 RepID=A0ABD6DPU0_9EURY|nr:hypothetical protein [Halobellus litoreus]
MHGFVDGSAFDYGSKSWTELEELISQQINKNARDKARYKTVLSSNHPIQVLENVVGHILEAEINVSEEEGFYSVELRRTIKRSEREVEGSFALFQHGDSPIWTAVTGYSPDFFERGLCWVFNRAEPDISDFFANSNELRQILQQVEEELSAEILVSKAVVYSRSEEGTISFRTRPYKAVFSDEQLEDGYVDKLNFSVRRQDDEFFSGFISREGVTKIESGDPTMFLRYLLGAFVETVADKIDVLSHRDRSASDEISEIELEFQSEVLSSPSDNKELIEALSNLKKSTMTVYHDNPYAHVSLVDFVDGSNCDIYVTGSNSVSIVPGYKGSVNFLMRIADQMSKEFQEGVLTVRDAPDYSLTDFVA